jgi:hypothetical protein
MFGKSLRLPRRATVAYVVSVSSCTGLPPPRSITATCPQAASTSHAKCFANGEAAMSAVCSSPDRNIDGPLCHCREIGPLVLQVLHQQESARTVGPQDRIAEIAAATRMTAQKMPIAK